MTTLLIADDQTMVREALAALLGMEPDFEVIAQCARGDEVLPAVRHRSPEVALLDVDMPGLDGLEVAALLAEEFPQVRVVIVTTYGRPGWVKRALDAGVSGFMVKDAPVDRLAEGIRRVMAGLQVIDPELVVESTVHGRSPLTERETEVLRAAADGGSVGEIASALFISSGTVRNRLSAGIGKTAARNRADAVRIARDNGWL
ncbi:MAG: response regulator [Brevibacterium aurantiacum]|uniref:DNA-binding response regulator n=1 Tax=Brevibacterium aurantiacum TaxID=273384 RepID=A0A2H1KVT8_BREAU|nr:response regulator transcription factor [Brevibacterium aurantiacum]MDN5607300.1 response regulator transcription factor [Brevibacterium sp.]AZL10924.1 DNA-binding response regulator [Brevibacterium aurantiacum]AZL14526.1 DNA-binding response regulator [Brevibacterium aurantiacum]AZT98853.1 DNA-binding response regulator [Brevibacterium aurantiacum]MDN5737021.1 response regulator transcription factor [Brevibacterium aurantiacum]